jgi:hypothetical protein
MYVYALYSQYSVYGKCYHLEFTFPHDTAGKRLHIFMFVHEKKYIGT